MARTKQKKTTPNSNKVHKKNKSIQTPKAPAQLISAGKKRTARVAAMLAELPKDLDRQCEKCGQWQELGCFFPLLKQVEFFDCSQMGRVCK